MAAKICVSVFLVPAHPGRPR